MRYCALVLISAYSASANSAAVATRQVIHISRRGSVEPATLHLERGQSIRQIEWNDDRKKDSIISFKDVTPCIEGHLIRTRRGAAFCTLKPAVCPQPQPAAQLCRFSYEDSGVAGLIVVEQEYAGAAQAAPTAPQKVAHRPGDTITVRTRKQEITRQSKIQIRGSDAIIVRIAGPHEAEVIVPMLPEGDAELRVITGASTENAGKIKIALERNWLLTLAVNPGGIELRQADPHPFDPEACSAAKPEGALITYSVNAAGKKTGCGAVTVLRPNEVFRELGPSRNSSAREYSFHIVVPRRKDQTVEFEAADERKLNELLGEPERTEPRKFNAIKVPF
jgi:hypothetical protein